MKIYSLLFIMATCCACAQQKNTIEASTVSSLSFRMVGPALTSGRVSDLAIHPSSTDTWYVSTASGGLWKTENHGITFKPIFDSYSSYSIGCVEIAPTNQNTVWVGTGENNNQRSVSYGDGVYNLLMGESPLKTWGSKTVNILAALLYIPVMKIRFG